MNWKIIDGKLAAEINGKWIKEGDTHIEKIMDGGQEVICKLEVFFDNGAFRVDESFEKDRSTSILASDFGILLISGS